LFIKVNKTYTVKLACTPLLWQLNDEGILVAKNVGVSEYHRCYITKCICWIILLFPNCSIKCIIHSNIPWTLRAKMSLGFGGDKYQWNGWFQKLSMLQNKKKHFMRINLTIRNINLVFQNRLNMVYNFRFVSKCYKFF